VGLPAELQTIADRREELVGEARAWATDRLTTGVTTIVQALADAGIEIPGSPLALPQLERARHTWVQVRQGNGWLDLDPLLPGAELGVAAATPEGEPFDGIPDDLRHLVRFRVTTDVISGDTLAQQAVLDQSFPTDTLDAASMILFHEKPDDLKGIGLAIGNALGGGGPQYQAILQTPDETYVGDSWLSLAGGDGGVFGGEGTREGAAVAEWLDVTVTSPDGTSRTTRRPIFDLVGADARAAGTVDVAAVPDPPLVSLGTYLDDEFQPLRDLWFLSVATGATDVDGLANHAGTTLDEVASTGLAASLYHVARDGISAELALDRGVRSFLNAPNVTAYVIGGTVQDDGTFDVASRVDLLHRAFGQLPVPDLPASAPPGIVAGVLSHVAERIQSGEGLPDLVPDPASGRPPLSAGAVLEAARDQAIELLVLRGDPPAGLAWPPGAASLLKAALADGWVAIAPATPVTVDDIPRLGWWLVDPTTGATLDVLDDGGGAVLAEDIVSSLKKVALWARPYICIGIGLAELAHLAHDLMSGDLVGAGIGSAAGAGAHKLLGCH
jgi:hypothetical protein